MSARGQRQKLNNDRPVPTFNRISELVVDVPMACLVVTDHLYYVPKPRIGRQIPVIYGNLGRRYVFVPSVIDLFQVLGIADDRLFLEVTDDPVRSHGRDQVKHEEKIVEHPLGEKDQ